MPAPRRKPAAALQPCIVTVDDDGTIPAPSGWRVGDKFSVYRHKAGAFRLINHREAREQGTSLPPGAAYTETVFARPVPATKPKRAAVAKSPRSKEKK